MNKIEKTMMDILKKLKNQYGVIGVKAEFEAEGSEEQSHHSVPSPLLLSGTFI
jgi:hypothetical protein